MREKFKISQAAKLAGFKTTSMVNYLCQVGLVKPTESGKRGRGNHRLFSFRDVLLLKSLNRLLSQGVAVKNLKRALKDSHDIKRLTACPDTLKCNKEDIRFMVTDGKDVFLKLTEEQVINLSQDEQFEFSFVLDLKKIHQNLSKDVKALPSAKH